MPGLQAIVRHPITRIVTGLALTLGIGMAAMISMQELLSRTYLPQSDKDPIAGTVFAFFVCAIYILLYHRYEKRAVTELSTRHLPGLLAGGILLGAGLASAVILIQYVAHVLTITATRPFLPLLPNLWNTFVNSIIAETLIIGIFFRLTEEWLGSWIALLILAMLFITLHITTPGATIVSAIAISMHTVLLGSTYIYTRNLWAPIAIHFAWDFCYAALYGASVNGYAMDNSLLNTTSNGSELLTGGYFGPQGSIQAAVLCLLTAVFFLQLSRKHNQIIHPSFRNAH
jgi:uncharacterized protein